VTTECSGREFLFPGLGGREGVARFDGGDISSDGGLLLLAKVESHTGIVERFARCFTDRRDPRFVLHPVGDLVRQRVYGLALGYGDLNDHEVLRHDPLFAAATGKGPGKAGVVPAGKSTLNRLELSRPEDAATSRYKKVSLDTDAADQVFVDVFVESYPKPPVENQSPAATGRFRCRGMPPLRESGGNGHCVASPGRSRRTQTPPSHPGPRNRRLPATPGRTVRHAG